MFILGTILMGVGCANIAFGNLLIGLLCIFNGGTMMAMEVE